MPVSWHEGRMVMFDLETTGVDPHRDRDRTRRFLTQQGRATPSRAPGLTSNEGQSGNAWIGLTLSGVAADLRAALDADTSDTQPADQKDQS